ncbi:MAG: ATP-binding protein [Bacteroidales bacterium]|nr:ATP-binding protein [Bacteroidales bacterium]
MEQMQFKISSFLKDLIGRELITDEFVAVFELVKNSFDAHAKKVKVIFENQYDPTNARIIIWDNGRGMDKSDLQNKWLFVAHSDKRDGTEDKDYRDKIQHKRTFAGAKGVGRFSCDRLGRYLNLISIKDAPNALIENLKIDWTSFEQDSNKEFIDIKVEHNTLSATNYEDFHQGTILEISGLRDIWDRDRIKKLKVSLEKLINPIQGNDVDDFAIEIIADDELLQDQKEKDDRDKVNGVVRNIVFERLGLKTTQIKVSITNHGGTITTTLTDRGTEIYTLTERNPYDKLYDIDIVLFVLNRAGKINFKKIMGVDSVKYGSVFIYKNGFRIYPFGEEGDDTLQIDRRKQQGFYRYLGTRDLLGRIEINGERSDLRETTSRDGGFIKNESWNQLVEFFYDKALRRLETYTVGIIKWGDEKFDKETGEIIQPELKPEDVKDKILDIISNLTKAKEVIDVQYNQDFLKIYESKQEKSATQLVKNLTRMAEETNNPQFVKQAKAVEKQVSEMRQSIGELERDNATKTEENKNIKKTVSQLQTENLFLISDVTNDTKEFKSLHHHITHTSDLIAEYISIAIEALSKGDNKRVKESLQYIEIENQKILTLSNFVSKAKFDTKTTKINDDIISFVYEYINNLYVITHKKLIVNVEKASFKFVTRFVPIEMIILIDNLLNNSEKAKAQNVSISWVLEESTLTMHYADDGHGIKQEVLPHVFEYRFSTTNGGGLGLYYVKEIVNKMKGSVQIDNSKSKGVEFIITLKK